MVYVFLNFFSLHIAYLAFVFFFFSDTATTEIYTLSLHDALPIAARRHQQHDEAAVRVERHQAWRRSEEHTSELQSRGHLVCRLLLEKKNPLKSDAAKYQVPKMSARHHSLYSAQ